MWFSLLLLPVKVTPACNPTIDPIHRLNPYSVALLCNPAVYTALGLYAIRVYFSKTKLDMCDRCDLIHIIEGDRELKTGGFSEDGWNLAAQRIYSLVCGFDNRFVRKELLKRLDVNAYPLHV